MTIVRASLMSLALLACDAEPIRDSDAATGMPVYLTATDRDREFRVHVCQGDAPPDPMQGSLEVETRLVVVTGTGEPMWLGAFVESQAMETQFAEVVVPGTVSVPLGSAEDPCSDGILVAFHRLDEVASGELEVFWTVKADADAHEELPIDVSIEIER